jgi:transposase
MGRPPSIPVEKKTRIVLSVLAGEVSIAEAARKEHVSEQSIGRWKADFLEAGRTALAAGKSGPSTREEQLEAEVAELTQALGEAAVEIRVWKKERGGSVGPFEDLEVIRVEAGGPPACGGACRPRGSAG